MMTSALSFHSSPETPLQPGPDLQETKVQAFEHPEHRPESRQQPQRPQHGNRPPHRGKGRSTGDDRLTPFLRMKTREQRFGVQRTARGTFYLTEIDPAATIQSTHQVYFPDAQGAVTVVPDGDP